MDYDSTAENHELLVREDDDGISLFYPQWTKKNAPKEPVTKHAMQPIYA